MPRSKIDTRTLMQSLAPSRQIARAIAQAEHELEHEHPLRNNANAVKPARAKASMLVTLRARPADVKRWDHAAKKKGTTRSKWLITIANDHAQPPPGG